METFDLNKASLRDSSIKCEGNKAFKVLNHKLIKDLCRWHLQEETCCAVILNELQRALIYTLDRKWTVTLSTFAVQWLEASSRPEQRGNHQSQRRHCTALLLTLFGNNNQTSSARRLCIMFICRCRGDYHIQICARVRARAVFVRTRATKMSVVMLECLSQVFPQTELTHNKHETDG